MNSFDEIIKCEHRLNVLHKLYVFCNNYKSLIFGIHDFFLEIFRRNPIHKDKSDKEIIQFIYQVFQFNDVDESIYELWGLLTDNEQKTFIENYSNIEN